MTRNVVDSKLAEILDYVAEARRQGGIDTLRDVYAPELSCFSRGEVGEFENLLDVQLLKTREGMGGWEELRNEAILEGVYRIVRRRRLYPDTAVILAAGRGTRLRPLTDTVPKAMVEVGGRPLLARIVDELEACGIRRIVFVIGHLGNKIVDYFGTRSGHGTEFSYVSQSELNGTGGAVKLAKPLVKGSYLIVFGDSYFAPGSARLLASSRWENAIGVVEVAEPRRYGVVCVNDVGAVVDVIEKPEVPPSNLVIAGLYKLGSSSWPYLDRLLPSARQELEIPDAIRAMIADGAEVGAEQLAGMLDVGTLEDLQRARVLALDEAKTA